MITLAGMVEVTLQDRDISDETKAVAEGHKERANAAFKGETACPRGGLGGGGGAGHETPAGPGLHVQRRSTPHAAM